MYVHSEFHSFGDALYVWVYACVHVCVCTYNKVCVCVREKEREKEREFLICCMVIILFFYITDLLEFAEDLLYSFGNSDESGGSDEESSDEFMDNLLRFLSDDESDTEFQFSPGMLLESHSFLPFDEQMDVETDASHSTPLHCMIMLLSQSQPVGKQ